MESQAALAGTLKSDACGAEAARCLQEELVETIHGAFEVAVQIAVREVKKLVGPAAGRIYEEMRRENESLKARLQSVEAMLELERVRERGGSPRSPKQYFSATKDAARLPNPTCNQISDVQICIEVRGDAPVGHSAGLNAVPQHEEQGPGHDDKTQLLHPGGELINGCNKEVAEEIPRVCVVKLEGIHQSCQESSVQGHHSAAPTGTDDRSTSEQVTVKQETPEDEQWDASACCLDSIKVEEFSLDCMSAVQSKMSEWEPEALDTLSQDSNTQVSCNRLVQDSEEDEGKERGLDTSAQTRCADMTSADLDKLEKSIMKMKQNEANTIRQTTWALNCLQTWMDLKNIQVNFQLVKKTELNAVLRQFYGSIRTTKGELYSISSYLGLRAGLNRYINEPPVSRSWNLMQDSEFLSANNVFKGVVKEIRRAGKDRTAHHPPISLEDQRILKHSAALSPDNPQGLLNKVWYDIQLHFGRRGKEGNRDLKPDSFVLKCDGNGAKYFTMSFNEETKNRERDREKRWGAMYEERGNALCPVASLEKYLKKIPPGAKALYLQPKRVIVAATDSFWFTTAPLGVNQLSQMLPRMCKEAGTHKTYTNHSLRATAIQKLSDAGLEAREIMAASGHRSESCRRPSESRKRSSSELSDGAVSSPEAHIMPPKRLPTDSYFSAQ